MDTLLSEQFSTHFDVCCVATRSILKPTDRITIKYRQELHEMLIFNQRLHISVSVRWPLSYKHIFGHGIVPMGVPNKLHFAKLKSAY